MNILGPEFQRNIWMRFSIGGLAVMPLLFGLILLFFYISYMGGNVEYLSDSVEKRTYSHHSIGPTIQLSKPRYKVEQHWGYEMPYVFAVAFFIFVILIGTIEAGGAFTSEIRDKTWDLQKTSAIRPWHLMIGKLFGSTSYMWYFGLASLAVLAYFHHCMLIDQTPKVGVDLIGPIQPVIKNPSLIHTFTIVGMFILSGVCAHTAAMIGGAQNIERGSTNSIGPFIFGLFIGFHVFMLAWSMFDVRMYNTFFTLIEQGGNSDLLPQQHRRELSNWYGLALNPARLILGSIGFFLFWAFVMLFRTIRKELNFKSFPFVLLGFYIALNIYFAGFLVNIAANEAMIPDKLTFWQSYKSLLAVLAPLSFMMLLTFYVNLYNESGRLDMYRRFFRGLKNRDWSRALSSCPSWLVSGLVMAVLMAVLFIGLQFTAAPEPSTALIDRVLPDLKNTVPTKAQDIQTIQVLLFSMLLLTIRDALALHTMFLGDRMKRAGFGLVVYYFTLYVLLPQIALASLPLMPHITGGSKSWVLATFYPALNLGYQSFRNPYGYEYLAPQLLQVLLFFLVFSRTIRSLNKSNAAPQKPKAAEQAA